MNRADTTTRRVTTAIVVSVGLFAGGDSYSHIFHLARDHGQDVVSAALVPLAGDGLVVAASATMLAAARTGKPVPARARLMMLGGIGATVAADPEPGNQRFKYPACSCDFDAVYRRWSSVKASSSAGAPGQDL